MHVIMNHMLLPPPGSCKDCFIQTHGQTDCMIYKHEAQPNLSDHLSASCSAGVCKLFHTMRVVYSETIMRGTVPSRVCVLWHTVRFILLGFDVLNYTF